METKSVTVGEFIDAIEKNGLPLNTGKLFMAEDSEVYDSYPRFDTATSTLVFYDPETGEHPALDTKIVSACAFGMGLINTGTIFDTFFMSVLDAPTRDFYRTVYWLNDQMKDDDGVTEQKNTLPETVALLRQEYLGREDTFLTLFAFDYTPYLEK